jgi:hypothetical protein
MLIKMKEAKREDIKKKPYLVAEDCEDDGNGVLWTTLLFSFSVCLRVTRFFCSL